MASKKLKLRGEGRHPPGTAGPRSPPNPGTHRQTGEALALAQDVEVLAQVPQAPAQGRPVAADLPQLLRQLLRLLLHPQSLPRQRRPRVFGTRLQHPPGTP